MALAFDAASGAKSDSGSSLTFAHTCSGSDRVLIVTTGMLSFPPASSPDFVTYNGVEMTQIWFAEYVETGVLEIKSEGWYLVSPSTGTHNVVVTWPTGGEICASAVSFTGADQTTPTGTPATGQAASATPSVTVSSATGEIVIDGIRAGLPGIAVGAGQTSRNEQELINFSSAGGTSTEPGAASVTMTWTMSGGGYGDKWAMGAVPVKPVSGSIGSGAGSASGTSTATGISGEGQQHGAGVLIFRPLPMMPVTRDVTLRTTGVSVRGVVNPPVVVAGNGVRVSAPVIGVSHLAGGVSVRTVRNPTKEQLKRILEAVCG